MTLNNCATALFVRDIETSVKFYTGVLGFDIHLDFGKNVVLKDGPTLWEIQPGQIIPSLLGTENLSHRNSFRFELYFDTDELEEVQTKLKESGVSFLHEIHEETWGQLTIRFFDPDNHLIEVGESMRLFVNRFSASGMKAEEIAARTGVPVEEVKRLTEN